MALRNIFVEGDEILRKKAREVKEITPRILSLLDDMKETMDKENGVGIAAPQVGVSKRVCLVFSNPEDESCLIEMINPEILEREGSQLSTEGCLSVPNKVGQVDRPKRVKVKFLDRNGNDIIRDFEDFDAIVVSHEIDHLDGVLYSDKAVNLQEEGGSE